MKLRNKILLQKKQRIVAVDDDNYVLNFLKKILTITFPECEIKCFEKIDNDFKFYIMENCVDLFIMDIILSDTDDGITISEDIISNRQGAIFLFISGYDFSEKTFKNLNGRCIYDFINKPIESEELIIIVSTLLNVAATYKDACHVITKPRKIKKEVEDLREHYMDLIEKDKLLIKRLKSASSI
jgi:DNA-binding NtrC family response regulator